MTDFPHDTYFDTATMSSGCAVSPDPAISEIERLALRSSERETGGQFILEQNYPNPFVGETTVPFTLATAADVRLDLFDLQGRKVAGVVRKGRSAGTQSIKLNLEGLGLAPGDYEYQLEVTNRHGVYRLRKLMTAE
ncbi:T9SS type A sorting domain-containing protein [Hymenobacter sp. BT523]|uniref:T9SS type A sorting domain-containing protein n=1 Tax=Hymenobacter sp. BT523 TaxID=2795725 RepID=UPI0018EAC4E8|nr:T9SS type A sorting domain-containing protein [Hymenobacter sp. BT523]MBJ6108765.1 T9SS type A sorting domain-containing protein [Hymenobacter sp. BT523]